MELLKGILRVTIYKLPLVENALINALSKLGKELACLGNDHLSKEVLKRHISSAHQY